MNDREWPSQSPGSCLIPSRRPLKSTVWPTRYSGRSRRVPVEARADRAVPGVAAFAVAVGVLLLALDQCVR